MFMQDAAMKEIKYIFLSWWWLFQIKSEIVNFPPTSMNSFCVATKT